MKYKFNNIELIAALWNYLFKVVNYCWIMRNLRIIFECLL